MFSITLTFGKTLMKGECALTCRYVAAECTKVFKLSFEYLYIYSQEVAIFAEKNGIVSLMFCQR